MFLTNVFFIPFLALRAAPEPGAGLSALGSLAHAAAPARSTAKCGVLLSPT